MRRAVLPLVLCLLACPLAGAQDVVEPGMDLLWGGGSLPAGTEAQAPTGPVVPVPSVGVSFYVACEFVFVATVCPTDVVRQVDDKLDPDAPALEPAANETTEPELAEADEEMPAVQNETRTTDEALAGQAVPQPDAPAPSAPSPGVVGPPGPGDDQRPLVAAVLPADDTARWELAAAAAAAALVVPSLLLKLAGIVVLRRRGGGSPVATAILSAISERPGVRHVELVRLIGRGNGTIEHHLSKLLRTGQVQRLRRGPATFYYLGGQALSAEDHHRMALQGATARRVVDTLQSEPGLSLVDLARRLGLAPSTVHYHVLRLTQAGLLVDARQGRRRTLSVGVAETHAIGSIQRC